MLKAMQLIAFDMDKDVSVCEWCPRGLGYLFLRSRFFASSHLQFVLIDLMSWIPSLTSAERLSLSSFVRSVQPAAGAGKIAQTGPWRAGRTHGQVQEVGDRVKLKLGILAHLLERF